MKILHELYNLGGIMPALVVLGIHLFAFLAVVLIGWILNPVFEFIEILYERLLDYFDE